MERSRYNATHPTRRRPVCDEIRRILREREERPDHLLLEMRALRIELERRSAEFEARLRERIRQLQRHYARETDA